MKNSHKIVGLIFALTMLLLSGCGGLYSARPITGMLVDADTGEPLPGVIIVAQWKINEHFVGYERALLKVIETTSTKNGSYHFPGWGPMALPFLADFSDGEDPYVIYFKPGYWPNSMKNELALSNDRRWTPSGGFKGDGQVVALRKWDGKKELDYYSALAHMIMRLPQESVDEWKSFPRLTLAVEKIEMELRRRRDLPWNLPVPHIYGFNRDKISSKDKAYLQGFNDE